MNLLKEHPCNVVNLFLDAHHHRVVVSVDLRDAFFGPLAETALKDNDVVFLTNDFEVQALKEFKKVYPNRHINVGVAEQNMVNVAAGLAWAGKKPIIFGMCNFVTLRCFEQIKLQIACMNLPVTIVGVGPEFSFNFDGPSHHAISDMTLMNTLPEMDIWNVGDRWTAENLGRTITSSDGSEQGRGDGPTYIRVDKGEAPDFGVLDMSLGYDILRPPNLRPTLITTGHMVERCLDIAKELDLGLILVSRLKPFSDNLRALLRIIGHPIVVDSNGPGSPLAFNVAAAFSSDNCHYSAFSLVSLKDRHLFEFGDREFLLKQHGLDHKTLRNRIYRLCPWHPSKERIVSSL